MADPTVPVTLDVLVKALRSLPPGPWYESEPFKTLAAVVIGGFLTIGGQWMLKLADLRIRSGSLKVAFHGQVDALRDAIRADLKAGVMSFQRDGSLPGAATYATDIFDAHVAVIGDLRDPTLVGHLARLFTLVKRCNVFAEQVRGSGPRLVSTDRRYIAGLAAALQVVTIVSMRLRVQTANLTDDQFSVVVSEEDAADKKYGAEIFELYKSET